MSCLLDTNTCSAYLKRPASLAHRFVQYGGRLYIPTIVLGELHTWAYRRSDPAILLQKIESDLLANVELLDYNRPCAEEFGRLRGTLMNSGISVNVVDLMIAAVALTHGLTLVTHNTSDFQNVPRLSLEDWLVP